MLPTDGMIPTFEIGLRVVNPNAQALSLAGLSYTINLAGNEIIKGVASDLPRVAAYGEGDVKLTATPNLLAGAKLFTDLMRSNTDSVDYAFEAKLDLVGFGPSIRIKDAGNLSLRTAR
jgi:LEA14-like dessication related protein